MTTKPDSLQITHRGAPLQGILDNLQNQGVVGAGAVAVVPSGNIGSTNVQAALVELDTEKQPLLVSGSSIKTLNGQNLLGSGNIEIVGGGGATTAALVSFNNALTDIPATNVQDALVNLGVTRQVKLVNQQNIRSVGGVSLLGTGNVDFKTVNGTSIVGSGNIDLDRLFINVRDYGAVGNGTTDDTAALQTAINIANSIGAVCWFPVGTYRTTAPLVVNNTADTAAFAPKCSLLGASPTASIIQADGGAFDVLAIAGGTVGSGMHSHQVVADLGISKQGGGVGLALSNCAYFGARNLHIRGCEYGIYATDTLSSSFKDCQLLFNSVAGVRMERSGTNDGYLSGPNAIGFYNCVLGANGHLGGWFTDGGCVSFFGGSIEGNGISGTGAFPKGGLLSVNAGLEAAVALNCSGTYFENNKGTADVMLNNTSRNTTSSFAGCTFNRVSAANYVDNNIRIESAVNVVQAVSVSGCGFKAFNDYIPSTLRPTIAQVGTNRVSWTGCLFNADADAPRLRNWTSDQLAYGIVIPGGQIAPLTRSHNIGSVQYQGTGLYRIDYAQPSESATNCTVTATANGSGIAFVQQNAPTHCTIQVLTFGGIATDLPVSFVAFG